MTNLKSKSDISRINSSAQKWTIHFHSACVEIVSSVESIFNHINILFQDAVGPESQPPICSFRVDHMDNRFTVFKDNHAIFTGKNSVEAVNALMNSVKYELIKGISDKLALHAALVSDESGSILIPGVSGSGKSSFTAWLLRHGFRYHSDELVLIDLQNQELIPFTRPIMIKRRGLSATLDMLHLSKNNEGLLVGRFASSIPHRLINKDYVKEPPTIRAVVFPIYSQDGNNDFSRLSSAQTTIELMRCNVLARNLPSHGTDLIKQIAANTSAFRCRYTHFDQLPALLNDSDLYTA